MADAAVLLRLQKLIDSITDSKEIAYDPNIATQIKYLCKQSDQYVALAFQRLSEHLRGPHAQVRIAVKISKFCLMAAHFTLTSE